MANLRDYGFGDSTPYLDGPPRVMGEAPLACPNCGCNPVYKIEVDMKDYPQLKPGKQIGNYLGCAACPWASPMVARVK